MLADGMLETKVCLVAGCWVMAALFWTNFLAGCGKSKGKAATKPVPAGKPKKGAPAPKPEPPAPTAPAPSKLGPVPSTVGNQTTAQTDTADKIIEDPDLKTRSNYDINTKDCKETTEGEDKKENGKSQYLDEKQ